MSHCRTGCPTQDHGSYAECLRSSGLRVAYANSAHNMDYSAQRRWDSELSRYRDLKRQGVQPEGSTTYHMDNAERMSDATGKPYVA